MRTWQVVVWREDGSATSPEFNDEDEARIDWKRSCRAAMGGDVVTLFEYSDGGAVEIERYEKESDR